MKHLSIYIIGLLLFSCSSNDIKKYYKIYNDADIKKSSINYSKDGLQDIVLSIQRGNKTILEYYYLLDNSKIYDDNFWQKLYIIIPDISDIEEGKQYSLDNSAFDVISQYGGAWEEVQNYKKIDGKIKFSLVSKDKIILQVVDSIKGYYMADSERLVERPILAGKVIYKPD